MSLIPPSSDLLSDMIPIEPALFPEPPYERDELLHEIFSQTAAKFPDCVAIRLGEVDPEISRRDFLTYDELRKRSSQFARYLASKGVRAGDRVVICLPRCLDQYMVVLGTLEAGAAYAPMDWSYPQDRIDYVMGDCEATAVVTLSERAQAFAHGTNLIILDQDLGEIAAQDQAPMSRDETGATPDDLAYLIYTSGSTGRPKGVMIRHRNACHLVRSECAILGVTPDDVIYGGFSLAFDMSVESMWSAFFAGAELLVGSENLAKAGPDLVHSLNDRKVSIWHVVPSLLSVIEEEVPSARIINMGGEACPPDLARRWYRPGRRLLNTYGPTETTVTSTWAELQEGDPITIGSPLPGYVSWIVDESLMPVAHGQSGELVIGGPGVGAGYVNRPDLTAEKFTFTPFNGPNGVPERIYRSGDLCRLDAKNRIEFLGRIDTQVKIRGYRVELGEIEAVLADDLAVSQAVVHLFSDEAKGDLLVAFLCPRKGHEIDLEHVRALAHERLPAYMRPEAYQILEVLPTLVSGKVDRKALTRPVEVEPLARDIVLPEGEDETALHKIWEQVFSPAHVSVLDDFFEDLGGHSLRAAKMVSMARKIPKYSGVSIHDVYAAPNIRALVQRLNTKPQQFGHHIETKASFFQTPAWKRALCSVLQTLGLIVIYTFSGLQWITPYLVYTWLAGDLDHATCLLAAGSTFVLIPPFMIAFSIAVKWLVIGRFKEGEYPLWGFYYFRWWFVRRFLGVIPTFYLAGSPFYTLYARLLGAKIGKNVFLSCDELDAADLIDIGDEAIISEGAMLATTSVERGLLKIGRVKVGARCHVGNMAVVGRGCHLMEGSVLDDLSALPTGKVTGPHEVWSGSPAILQGEAANRPEYPKVSLVKKLWITLGLFLVAPLLPLAVVLPVAPGLFALIEMDWDTSGYTYLMIAPALALIYVILMCVVTAVAKWALLGKVRPGTYSIWSGFYVRYWFVKQLGKLALELLHPLYATLYVRPWYQLMGAKVGPRAEISTATSVIHDLIDIGRESFIADGVVFGAARAEPGFIRLDHTKIGERTFMGNSSLLPAGTVVGDRVLIGVLSKPPAKRHDAMEPDATWFGSPAIRLPTRQQSVVFDEGARFRPSFRLILTRLSIEFVRVILSLTVFISLFSVLLSAIGDLSEDANRDILFPLAFPFLYMGFCLGAGMVVLVLKWVIMGRYKATTAPLWSTFVWRTELVTSTYENLAVPLLLDPLRGTPFLNIYMRLMGCKIGKRVYMDSTDITEHDLVELGDDVAINDAAGLQTHLFEDRVMKVSGLKVGDRATLGSMAIALYDSEIEADAQLGDLSVLMKGETLPPGTSWEGSPARQV